MNNQSNFDLSDKIGRVIRGKRAVVVCGEGGVGKTTMSSLLAYSAARDGQNALVFTIDPARRLKDALGMSELTGAPVLVKEFAQSKGQFWAVTLNVETVWESLLESGVGDEHFTDSRFYRLLKGSFPGLSELAAVFSLDDFLQSEDFDTVIIDTAPSQNALNFLLAPERMLTVLEMPFSKLLKGGSSFLPSFTSLRDALGDKLDRIGKSFFGEGTYNEIASFSAALSRARPLIYEKSERIKGFVDSRECGIVTVVRADDLRSESVEFFARAARRMDGVVVNRVRPYFRKERQLIEVLEACRSRDAGELKELLDEALQSAQTYLKMRDSIQNSYACAIVEVADQPSAGSGLEFFEHFFEK